MKYSFIPRGVCARQINLDIEDGKIKDCEFIGGCSGNTKGICRLIKGLQANEVIEKLEGTRCGGRPTSCPDQLAKALKTALNQ